MIEQPAPDQSVRERFAAASRRLRRLVRFDAAAWLAIDPLTALPSGPAWLENVGADICVRCWEAELLNEDANSFRALGRAATPAGVLSAATGGYPARSPRYREVLEPGGFGDELRVVLRTGGSVWGSVALLRERGRPAFDSGEIELAAALSQPLAEAIRDDARRPLATGTAAGGQAKGFMLFAPNGELISRDEHAPALLAELPSEPAVDAGAGVRVPIALATVLVAARAVAERRTKVRARTRLASRKGRLLAAHASCLADANGSIAATALVIEPAAGSDISALAVRAHELTARERQIARLISQGRGTTAMAQQLHLSIHTVRDHVKSICEKLRVSSRGELVAKLTGRLVAAAPPARADAAAYPERHPPTAGRALGRDPAAAVLAGGGPGSTLAA